MPLRVGSLFAGIGGIDLGLERAGMTVAWQCEIDEYCQQILDKHWPNVPVYNDVQTLYTDDGPEPKQPDILCGGFPCQDISYAGEGAGLDGERSGLWWEYARLIRVLEPRYAILENVPALVNRGLQSILGWLTENGYDAEWQIISAAAFGAPHLRERLFTVAYPSGMGRGRPRGARRRIRDGDGNGAGTVRRRPQQQSRASGDGEGAKEVADAASPRRDASGCAGKAVFRPGAVQRLARCRRSRGKEKWATEPEVGRLADGIPDRVDRTRALGNAVVPQVAEFVGRCIVKHYRDSRNRT